LCELLPKYCLETLHVPYFIRIIESLDFSQSVFVMGFIFFVFQVFIVFLLSFVQRRAKAQPFENRFPYLRGRFGIVV